MQGLRTNELEVLALEAEAQGAELLVIAVGYKNFEHPHLVMLDYGASDVDLLAGLPHLWQPLLNSTVTGESADLDDLLVRCFQVLTHLGRLRRPILDSLSS